MSRYRTGQEARQGDVVELGSGTRDGKGRRKEYVVRALQGPTAVLFDEVRQREVRDVPCDELVLVRPAREA